MIQIDILAHADFSGRIKRTSRQPGYAAFATTVDALRRENPDGTLLLDAGDSFSTTFWGGLSCVQSEALLGPDAMTLGNHEFDRGPEFLNACIAAAPFPILCANVTERATGELIAGVKPYTVIEKRGVKIGVVGVTTEYTPYMVTASSFAPYEMHSALDALNRYIPKARQDGAEIVIVLAHMPFYIDGESISGELPELIPLIPPVDVCMGGHIPGDYAGITGGTVVLKGGFGGRSICRARLMFDEKTRKTASKSGFMHHTDRDIPPDAKYLAQEEAVTAPYRAFFEDVLAVTDERWAMRLSRETRLGNFLSGCVKEQAGVDIAYMNATSASGVIEPGPVIAEDITSVMGYNDPIMTSTIMGDELYRLFELVFVPERYGNNAGLIYAGVVVHADHTRPAFSKIQLITLADGTPIERDRSYTVATSEYMASGGNDTGEIANARKWTKTDTLIYDALFASVRLHGCLHVSPEQRMYEIGRPENDNAPY